MHGYLTIDIIIWIMHVQMSTYLREELPIGGSLCSRVDTDRDLF